MKHLALYFGIVSTLVASCSIQEKDFENPQQDDVIFYASFEQPAEGTKVYANEDLHLRWTADDRVSIFNKNTYNQQYKFLGETGDNAGEFSEVSSASFVTGNEMSHIVSVYPYQDGTKISESGVITVNLPAEQHYAENTFGLGANTMVSVSEDNFLQYKNVGGYLRLSLYGEDVSVSSITLKGNNGEKLAGKVTVTMPLDGTPTVVLADDATGEITLICDTPVALGATAEESVDFWFVVPPVTFSAGFTITVNDKSSGTFEKSTPKSIAIERNRLSKMSPMEVKFTHTKNVIIYTSTDGNIVTPRDGVFGAVVLSNEYKDGYGAITFDDEVTSIGDYAFMGCTTLSSITIPEGVTEIGAAPFCEASSLTSIVVDLNNPHFDSRDNCNAIIETRTNQLVSGCKRTIIPSSVTSVGEGAFYGCINLNSITIPSSVTSIGGAAFGHTNLYKLTIPESVTDIDRNPVNDCPYLYSISVASGNLYYDSRDDCNAIIETNTNQLIAGCFTTTIPSSVTSIGKSAFESCLQLRHITIPEGVTSIGDSAFNGCFRLNSVDIASSVTKIDYLAFYSCSSLISVTVRAVLPPSIDYRSFELSNDCLIYVPSGSIDAYKSAQCWSIYADQIQAILFVPIPEAVDLGLPSGLKWASFNLGASNPEEFGDYYAWGETEPQDYYDWATYKWCMGSYGTLIKYCSQSGIGYNGFSDGRFVLASEDDAAHVKLGGLWRMPKDAEFTELRTKCTWALTTINGINGEKVTGPNGNSIFLPAAGFRAAYSLYHANVAGNYWSSSLYKGGPHEAWSVNFGSNGVVNRSSSSYRCRGLSIRPVCD